MLYELRYGVEEMKQEVLGSEVSPGHRQDDYR